MENENNQELNKETENTEIKEENKEENKKENKKEKKCCKRRICKKVMWIIIGILVFVIIVQIAVADKYKAQVLVIEGEKKVGVNPTTEKLDFGDLSADTSAVRYVTLNAGGIDTYVHVLKFGSIAELVKLSENSFTMKKGNEKKLEFSLYMPPSAPIGEKYTGSIWIFKIPKIW